MARLSSIWNVFSRKLDIMTTYRKVLSSIRSVQAATTMNEFLVHISTPSSISSTISSSSEVSIEHTAKFGRNTQQFFSKLIQKFGLLSSVKNSVHSRTNLIPCTTSVWNTSLFLLTLILLAFLFQTILSQTKKYFPNFYAILFSILTWPPIILLQVVIFVYAQSNRIDHILASYPVSQNRSLYGFLFLASWKAVKIVVHPTAYYINSPAKLPRAPSLFTKDITVIVPSIGDFDDEFRDCIKSIYENKPYKIIIVTTNDKYLTAVNFRAANFVTSVQMIDIQTVPEPNKRLQFIHGVDQVVTSITAYADDHVFWPPTLLKSCLANFEEPTVGLVGTVKRVLRDRTKGGYFGSFMNYIACMYLERHNFECTASYNVDGGVFVISGRTALVRTDIVQSFNFRTEFLDEHWGSPNWLWGMTGPLAVDDDNFITRFVVNHGYKTVFHNKSDALMKTTLGVETAEKFRGQLIRWARTTWRSNSTSLFADRVCWKAHPWTTYAMMISAFFNVALLYDLALWLTFKNSELGSGCVFFFVLFLTKIIKPLPHLCREPRDIGYFCLGILFGYAHGLIKLYALFTMKNVAWLGRNILGPDISEAKKEKSDTNNARLQKTFPERRLITA